MRFCSLLRFTTVVLVLVISFGVNAMASVKRMKTLISVSWTLQPGENQYQCSQFQAKNDMYISGFTPVVSAGTYRMIVTVTDIVYAAGTPNFACDLSTGTLEGRGVYSWAPGMNALTLPSGVGVYIPAGKYVFLNVHAYNGTANVISGTSSVAIQTVTASKVTQQAQMVVAGTRSISVPNDGVSHRATGGCFAPTAAKLFAASELTDSFYATRAALSIQTQTIFEVPYDDANEQTFSLPAPFQINAGDQITATCTYVNNGSTNPITYGEAYDSPRCFVPMYVYPADSAWSSGTAYGMHGIYGCVAN